MKAIRTVTDAIEALSRLDPDMPMAVSACGHWLAAPWHADSHGALRLAVVRIGIPGKHTQDVAMLGFGSRLVNEDPLFGPVMLFVVGDDDD